MHKHNYTLRLKEWRKTRDLSQTELAFRLNLDQSQYSKLERGLTEPKLSQLLNICAVLNIDMGQLIESKWVAVCAVTENEASPGNHYRALERQINGQRLELKRLTQLIESLYESEMAFEKEDRIFSRT